MRFLVTAALAFVAMAAVSFAAEPLRLSPSKGPAPLSVTITGPQTLLELVEKCVHSVGWITPGFSIEWGDGTRDPNYFDAEKQGQSCAHVKTHRYTVPGTYTIKARRYHLGPTDAPITDWEGTATITVTGQAVSQTGIELLSPQDNQEFAYQRLERVTWRVQSGEKADIRLRLVDVDGQIIDEQRVQDVAYSGEGRGNLLLAGNAAYEAALKADKNPFTLEVAAMRGDAVLAADSAENLILTPVLDIPNYGARVTPVQGKAPLNVTLDYSYFHPACFSYSVDWGDGSAKDEKTQTAPASGCKLDGSRMTLTHVYTQPGSYAIIVRTNNVDPFKKLDEIVPYERIEIEVLP